MEGMLMLLVMMFVTVVLAWVLDGKQRKQAVSLLLCAAMMSSNIPAITVARADSAAKPVLVNEQVLVNGTKTAQIGAVTYSASGSAYTLDTSSARVRVKNGDSISFDGAISAPEGETISWVRVDVYDANTEEPYTVGAEYYRASGMKVQEFDLASIPALTIGEAFGSKDYTLVEGGKYIVMFCVGDSNGNTFADMDADIEDDQGPAILVDVKLSPSNCDHPHSDYCYVRHSSGEVRRYSYGDSLTHQVEPLYERYCGLCDIFLMNIWGQGSPEEHTMEDGVCTECGYAPAMMMAAWSIPAIQFTSPEDRTAYDVGDTVPVKWKAVEGTEEYVVYVKILDGEPVEGAEDEAGTLIVSEQNWTQTDYRFALFSNAADKWVKINVHGKTSDGIQTEAASSLYVYYRPESTDPSLCGHYQQTAKYTTEYYPIENDDEFHEKRQNCAWYCGNCGTLVSEEDLEPVQEAHEFYSDGRCSICRYKKELPCDHTYSNRTLLSTGYQKKDDTHHYIVYSYKVTCQDCGTLIYNNMPEYRPEEHVFNGSDTCTACGWAEGDACLHLNEECTQFGNTEYSLDYLDEYEAIYHSAETACVLICADCWEVLAEDWSISEWELHSFDSNNQCTACGYIGKDLIVDNTAPQIISFTSSVGTTVTIGEMPTYEAVVYDENLRYVELTTDDGWTLDSVMDPVSDTVDVSAWSYAGEVGTYTFKIVAVDYAGNSTEKELVITVVSDETVCQHVEYTDFDNGQIKYIDNKDGETHIWQNCYNRICNVCNENLGVVYGVENPADHDYTNGDVCPCGYEATFVPECEHLNKVIDESSIVVEKQTENEHTISYWHFCNDCKTLLNNIAREESTAAHTFDENEVCTVCGYTKNPQNLPTMTFTVDKPVVNAGEEVEFTFTMTGGSPMANKVMLYAEDRYILTVGPNENFTFDSNPEIGVFKWKYRFNEAGLRKIHFVPLYENTEKTEHVEGVPTAVQEIRVNAYLNLLVDGVLQDTTTRKMALTVYDNGGPGTPITVDSNVTWSVKTDASWIKLTADTANKQILHEYEVNNTGAARVGTITVSAPGCEDWVITCTQETVPLTWGMWTDGSYVNIQASGSAMNPNHTYIAHVYRDGNDTCLKEVELEEALSEFHYYYGLGVVRGTTYRVQVEEKDANGTTLRTSGLGTFKFGLYATLDNIKSGSVNVTNTKEITAGDSISCEWDGSLGLDAYVYALINGTRITLHSGKSGTSAVTETISASQYEHLLTSDRTKIDIYVEVESLKKSWSGYIVRKQNAENYEVWYRFTGENDQSDHKASGTIYVYPDWVDYVTIWATNDSGEWIQPRKYGILSAQKDEYYFEVSGDTGVIEYSKSAQGFLVKSEGSATVRIMQNNKLIVSVDVVVGARSSGGLNIDGNQYYVKLKYTDDNGKMNSLEYGKAATSGASFGRLSQIRTMRDSVNVELEIVNANGYGLSVFDFTELYWTVQGDSVQGQGDNFTLQLPWVMVPDNGARYTFTLKQKQTLADKELIKFDVDVLYSDEFFERYSLYSDDLVFGDRYALEMGVDAYTVLHQSAREVTFKCKDNLTGEFKQINSYDGRNKFGVKAEWGLEKTDGCSFLFQGTGIQTITLYRGNAGPLALPVASLKIAILDSQPTLQENLLDFEKNIVQAQNYFEAEKASDLRNEINNSIDALGKDIEDAVSFIDPNKRYDAEAKDIFDADNIEYIMYLNRTGGLGHSAVLLTDERGNSLIVSFYPDENAVWGEKVYNTGETRMRYLSAFETYNLVYGENGGELSDLYERNTAAGGNLMSNNYWNSYGYRTEEAYTRGSVKAVDNSTGRSMYDTCIGLFSKETKYNAIWQNCDDIALSIFAENWYEQENIEGRIPNLTPGQTFDAIESLGYESVVFGNEPASALPVGIIQLHNSVTRTDNHIAEGAVNVVDAVVKTINNYDEYFVQRIASEGVEIFDQEKTKEFFRDEFYHEQLIATLNDMYSTDTNMEEHERIVDTDDIEKVKDAISLTKKGAKEIKSNRFDALVNMVNGFVGDEDYIDEKTVAAVKGYAEMGTTVADATEHIADGIIQLLTETEQRIDILQRIKEAADKAENEELVRAAESLITEYENVEMEVAKEMKEAFAGWAADQVAEKYPPYKAFKNVIEAGKTIAKYTGLTASANAHDAAVYGNSIEYSIMLGCMVDIEDRNSRGEAISSEEWDNYYIMAQYVYTSRINQIDIIAAPGTYIDDGERTRLEHARRILEEGLEQIKEDSNK